METFLSGGTHLNVNKAFAEHLMVDRMISSNVVDTDAEQRFEMCFVPGVCQQMLNNF